MAPADDPLLWRKSSRSSNGANCVEVAPVGGGVLARDSKNAAGPVVGFGSGEWSAFLATIKSGALDLA